MWKVGRNWPRTPVWLPNYAPIPSLHATGIASIHKNVARRRHAFVAAILALLQWDAVCAEIDDMKKLACANH
jgi:hypothetical protein